MGLHIIVHMGGICQQHSLKGIQPVSSMWCLIREVFPRSRSLQANRCFHLTSSFLSWSCSSLGHSSRPWWFSSFRIHPFWGIQADSPKVSIWRATSGTWFAGATLPTTTFVWITMGQALRFLRQIGTWQEPGCNSPYLAVSTTEVGSWGASCWLSKHMDPCTVPLHICVAVNIDGPKQGNGDPLCGMDLPLDIIQTEFLGCSRVGGCRGSDPLHSNPVPHIFAGQLKWPRHNNSEVGQFPCSSCSHKSPFVIIPITLSIILDLTMTGTFSE